MAVGPLQRWKVFYELSSPGRYEAVTKHLSSRTGPLALARVASGSVEGIATLASGRGERADMNAQTCRPWLTTARLIASLTKEQKSLYISSDGPMQVCADV